MRLDTGGGRWRGLSEQLDPVPYRPLPALRELQLAADIGGGDHVGRSGDGGERHGVDTERIGH